MFQHYRPAKHALRIEVIKLFRDHYETDSSLDVLEKEVSSLQMVDDHGVTETNIRQVASLSSVSETTTVAGEIFTDLH